MTATQLYAIANRLRLDVLEAIHAAGDGHPGPCMSIAEAMAVLFFDRLRLDPANPRWQQRDRFILSKGHACPILYAALARRGFFAPDELKSLRTLGGMLQGHPDMNKTPGVDSVSGSLGNGVSIGLGMALGMRMQRIDRNAYVIVGDGEMQEGVIWEAAMAAAKHRVGSLIVLGDCNGSQSGGRVSELSSLYPVADKWRAFQWQVIRVDGHDVDQLRAALDEAEADKARPTFIEMKTVKGKNISYMEHNNAWHKRTPTAEELEIARRELEVVS